MTVFYREHFSQLWIKLQSNEVLGILDSDYLEDFYGVDGQITLFHRASGARFTVLMVEVPQETPQIPHDVFQGYRLLSGLPDGIYEVQARVHDVYGNYTIIGDFQNPSGGERRLSLTFEVKPGNAALVLVVQYHARSLRPAYSVRAAMEMAHKAMEMTQVASRGLEIAHRTRAALGARWVAKGGNLES